MYTEQVIFIHIPKAAGQTMRSVLARQYPRHGVVATNGGIIPTGNLERADSPRIWMGHLHYGFHEHLRGASVYVTMLREPVSRVLSLYRYIATNARHPLHHHVAQNGLIDFVSSQVDAEEVQDGQTRQIAGVTDGTPGPSSLVRREANLADTFAAVGLVERFDESLVLFKRRLGSRMPFYVRKNVTPRLPVEEDTNEALEIIRGRNALDTELYEYGSELFGKLVSDEGPLFSVEVSAFQKLNAAAGVYRGIREWGHGLGGKGGRGN